MKNAVILCAHGEYATGVASGLSLVLGENPNLRKVDFHEGDGFDQIDAHLTQAMESLQQSDDPADRVLVLTDLMGGTPFNRAALLFGQKENVRVLSGLNFGMAYQALNGDETDMNAYVEGVMQTAKESIAQFAMPEPAAEKTDEEDGI